MVGDLLVGTRVRGWGGVGRPAVAVSAETCRRALVVVVAFELTHATGTFGLATVCSGPSDTEATYVADRGGIGETAATHAVPADVPDFDGCYHTILGPFVTGSALTLCIQRTAIDGFVVVGTHAVVAVIGSVAVGAIIAVLTIELVAVHVALVTGRIADTDVAGIGQVVAIRRRTRSTHAGAADLGAVAEHTVAAGITVLDRCITFTGVDPHVAHADATLVVQIRAVGLSSVYTNVRRIADVVPSAEGLIVTGRSLCVRQTATGVRLRTNASARRLSKIRDNHYRL